MTFIPSARSTFNIFILLIVLVLSNSCSEDPFNNIYEVENTNFSFVEEFSFNGPISSQGTMNINGINGSISIAMSDSNSFLVKGTKSVFSASEADAADYMNQLRVKYEPGSETVTISTEQPLENNGRVLKVDYEILIPKYLEINITQTNGDITLDSTFSESQIELTNGKIELINHSASIHANLINGNVLGLVDLPPTIESLCAINIVNGTIDLTFPLTTSAELSASIINGTINISNNFIFQNQVSSARKFSGTLNAGDGTIELEVQNGIIQLEGI